MRIKPGIRPNTGGPEIYYALGVADHIYRNTIGEFMTITSLNDGEHTPLSLHYLGRAVDIRTKDLTRLGVPAFHAMLLKSLYGRGFDVLNEGDHIHIEYDPKQGRTLFTEP